MKRIALCVVVGSVLACGQTARAEDTVYFLDPATRKEVSVRGIIDGESPAGIKLRMGRTSKLIPALDITQVVYNTKDTPVSSVDFREPDKYLTNALRETRPAMKADLLKAALVGFQELDKKLRDQPNIHRYCQYRIAQVTAWQRQSDPTRLDAAIAALTEFKTGSSTGWQIVPALKLLAQLNEEKGDLTAASQAYADLAETPGISEAMKLQSQLLVARLLLRASKFAEAERKLKTLLSSLPKDDPQRTFVDVYLAQSQMEQGNFNGVEAKLKAAISASDNKDLRALAHNFLGDHYRRKTQLEAAFWEYLKVDTLYNQDKEEHAKALYYLSQLFDKSKNDPVRAEECRVKLKSTQYDGTTYQRLAAAAEKKTP